MTRNKSDKQMNTVKAEMSAGKSRFTPTDRFIQTNEPVQGQAAIYEPDSKKEKRLQDQNLLYEKISDLVSHAKAGSQNASEELLDRLRPLIHATVKRHHTQSGPEWEDLLQSAALSLLEGLRNYDEGRTVPFLAYIKNKLNFDIYNLCRKERNLAARRIYTDKADAEPLDWLADESADIEENLLNKELNMAIREALMELEPKYREIVILHCFNKLTLKECAKRMGISYKTAQRYKAKSFERLAGLLGE